MLAAGWKRLMGLPRLFGGVKLFVADDVDGMMLG